MKRYLPMVPIRVMYLHSTSNLPRSQKINTGLEAGIVAKTKSKRDLRLDFFRGLALCMIFINHLPNNFYERFTNRNFGFSDSAEGFVLMSGMAAGIAYGAVFARVSLWRAVAKVWGRAWQLYQTHLVITVLAIGIVAAGALLFGIVDPLFKNNLKALWGTPLKTIVGFVTLGHQMGYVNILPMYMVLLLATPFFILVGRKHPYALALFAVLGWALSAHFRINLPAYPNAGGWFFNPFCWQLLFVLGLLTGLHLREGKRFIPFSWPLVIICSGYLLFSLVWKEWSFLSKLGNSTLRDLYELGLPYWITSFDKTFLSMPRLLHILSLAYVISVIPQVTTMCETKLAAPIVLFGQYGLAIFASGTVIDIALQVVKNGGEVDFVLDTVLIGGGFIVLYLIAYTKSRLAVRP
jgi:hypothetical protein